jgi:hypothetical protein
LGPNGKPPSNHKGVATLSKIKMRVEGHYEVEEGPYGKDYVWTPAHALVDCDCGRSLDVDAHHTTCPDCGADHSRLMREIAERHLEDEALHPWHAEYEEWLRYKEDRTEFQDWLEQRELS